MSTDLQKIAQEVCLAPILKLQAEMAKLPQVELETLHYFADGMYCRWLYRPKGTLIVGKVHKKEHFYLVIQGCVQVEKTLYRAPSICVSAAGTKRAVLALEDSVCITIHRTDKTDLDEIEKEIVEDDPDALFDFRNHLKLKELPP